MYRVVHLNYGKPAHDEHVFTDLAGAEKLRRAYTRRGMTAWVETTDGKFVPVKGFMRPLKSTLRNCGSCPPHRNGVGRSWTSIHGKKTVVGVHGSGRYIVQTDGRPTAELVAQDALEKEIDFDTRQLASRQRMQEASHSAAAKKVAETRAHEDTFGYAETFPPMKRRRIIDTLNKHVRSGGSLVRRKDLIASRVRDGWSVRGDRFESPDGDRFLFVRDITKIGADFAQYLIEKGQRNGRGRRRNLAVHSTLRYEVDADSVHKAMRTFGAIRAKRCMTRRDADVLANLLEWCAGVMTGTNVPDSIRRKAAELHVMIKDHMAAISCSPTRNRKMSKKTRNASGVYLTSYCNKPHDMKTGKPIEHECYVIPPRALELERDGDVLGAIRVMEQAKRSGRMRHHMGMKARNMGGKTRNAGFKPPLTHSGLVALLDDVSASGDSSILWDLKRKWRARQPGMSQAAHKELLKAISNQATAIDARLEGKIDLAMMHERMAERSAWDFGELVSRKSATRNPKKGKKMAKKKAKKKASKKKSGGFRLAYPGGMGALRSAPGAYKPKKKKAKKKSTKKKAKKKATKRAAPKRKPAKKKAKKLTAAQKLARKRAAAVRKAKRTRMAVKASACRVGRAGRKAQGKKPGKCPPKPKLKKGSVGAPMAKRMHRAYGHAIRNFYNLSEPLD